MNFTKRDKINILIIFTISIFLIIVWFHNGLIKGVAEPGLPFFKPHITFNAYKYVWLSSNLGEVVLSKNTLLPLFTILTLFEKFGFPSFFIQALTFLFILSFQGVFVYLLTLLFVEGPRSKLISLIAAIFYIFNPASLTFWNIFQFPLIYFYAFLPAAIFFYTKGLSTCKIKYSFYFNLVALLFSCAFENFVLFATLLFFIFLYTILFAAVFGHRTKFFWYGKYFLLTLLLWVLFNVWWLIPYYKTTLSDIHILIEGFNIQFNLSNFRFISQEYGKLIDLIRLDFRWLTSNTYHIWNNFSLLFFKMATFFIPIITILPLLFIKKKIYYKNLHKVSYFFIALLLLVLIFVTGANFPLGNLKLWLFNVFTPFQIFRNPILKIGILLPLCYSIPFAIGLYYLILYLKKKWSVFVIAALVFSLSWPMATGYIFTCDTYRLDDPLKGYSVKVPDYYLETKSLLLSEKQDFKILVLPLNTKLELVVQNWDYGYNGREIFNHVFERPSVAVMTWFKTKDDFIKTIEKVIYNDTKNVIAAMKLINAKFLIICNDLDWEASCFSSSFESYTELSYKMQFKKIEDLTFYRSFGKLTLYEIEDKAFSPHIYISMDPSVIVGGIETLEQVVETRYLEEKPVLLFTEQMKETEEGIGSLNDWGRKASFVFKDPNWRDLAVEITDARYQIQDASEKTKIKINKAGVYEFYIDASEMEGEIPELEIKVDGKVLMQDTRYPSTTLGASQMQGTGRRYVKIGEVELEKGRRTVEVIKVLGYQDIRQDLKIVLVSKEERENAEKLIWEKINKSESEIAYIFSKDGEFYVP